MRFSRSSLNVLVAVDALRDGRKVTHAAERPGLSQSAISGMPSRPREYFDDELLVPVGPNLKLTRLASTTAVDFF